MKNIFDDNMKKFHYKDIEKIYFILPDYVKQLTDLQNSHPIPGGNKVKKVKEIKDLLLDIMNKNKELLDKNFSIKNIELTTIYSEVMKNDKKISFYDRSKKGEKVTFEIHVNFIDVIALRICNQPYYKLITYNKNVSTLEHLKETLTLKDFEHHPDNLTADKLKDELEFTYEHQIMPKGNFESYIKRGQYTDSLTILVDIRMNL